MYKKPNYYWRLLATASSFALFGIGGLLVPPVSIPVLYLSSRDPQVRRRRARKLVCKLFRFFVRYMELVGVLSWSINGLEKLRRDEGMVVVANHPTLLDIVFLVGLFPNADCIVKGGVMQNPVMKRFVKLTGYITNDQGESLIDQAQKSLGAGSVMIIFPEGTRTRCGQPFSFQRGAANIIIRTGAAMIPIVINCTPPTLSKQHRWYHIPDKKFHMSFNVLDKFDTQPYEAMNKSKAARSLTRDMQDFYTRELLIDERDFTGTGT